MAEESPARFHPELERYIRDRALPGVEALPDGRRRRLTELSAATRSLIEGGGRAPLLFICTHNSRRSHLGQVWAAAAAAWYRVGEVVTFSGGTEATAFDRRAADALDRAGFQVQAGEGDNPVRRVSMGPALAPMECFSKRWDEPPNPSEGFVAVMTCSEADEACPVVHGAAARLSLPYQDPKLADGTPEETRRYDERCLQIATEMLFSLERVATG